MVFALRNVAGLAADIWWSASAGEGLLVCKRSALGAQLVFSAEAPSSTVPVSCLVSTGRSVVSPWGLRTRAAGLRGFRAPLAPGLAVHCVAAPQRGLDTWAVARVGLFWACCVQGGACAPVSPGGSVGLEGSVEACVHACAARQACGGSQCCVLASAWRRPPCFQSWPVLWCSCSYCVCRVFKRLYWGVDRVDCAFVYF